MDHSQRNQSSSISRQRKVTLRAAAVDDFYRFFGYRPQFFAGIAVENDVMILGIGGIYMNADLGFMAMIEKAKGVRGHVKHLHRATKMVLKSAKDADIAPIHALPDKSIKGSGRYLERLGFVDTGRIYNNHRVFEWQPQQ